MGQTSSTPSSRNRRRSPNAQGGSNVAAAGAPTSALPPRPRSNTSSSHAHAHHHDLTPTSSRNMPQPVQLHFNALLTPQEGGTIHTAASVSHGRGAGREREQGGGRAAAATLSPSSSSGVQSSPLPTLLPMATSSTGGTAPSIHSSLCSSSSSSPQHIHTLSQPQPHHQQHNHNHLHQQHQHQHFSVMTPAGQRNAEQGSNASHASPRVTNEQEPPMVDPPLSSSSPSPGASSSRMLRSTTERRRRTNLFSAFYPLLSRNSSSNAASSSSSNSNLSSSVGGTSSSSRAIRSNGGTMNQGTATPTATAIQPSSTNNSTSSNYHTHSNNHRHTVQAATFSSASPSPSPAARTPRGLTRVRQRMHDEVSLRSTRSSSSHTSSFRGVASSTAPGPSSSSPWPLNIEDTQMEIDLDSIGQQSHPPLSTAVREHATESAAQTAALATSANSSNTGTAHVTLNMEPAGMSSNMTLRPTTRYHARASQPALSPPPISTANFGSSSISTTGATGVPEPSSASTASSMSDASSTPAHFNRFSIGLSNPRGGTSISSSLLPIRPDSDDEEQDMALDPTIDHQPMATDDAETASSVAVSMAEHQHPHHHYRTTSSAPRRRDLNPPPELIAEIIRGQFMEAPTPGTSSSASNDRPLSTASSTTSSLIATAPTATPGVSSSNSSIINEHHHRPSTLDSYPMTRSRSAQLAAAAAAAAQQARATSSTSGSSVPSNDSGSGGNTSNANYSHLSSSNYNHLQYNSHINHYGEGSSTSYAGRRPTMESTESNSMPTASLRRRTTGTTTSQEQPSRGYRTVEFVPIFESVVPRRTTSLGNYSSSSSSSSEATGTDRTTEEAPPSLPTTPAGGDAARERFRQLQTQIPLFTRLLAHMTGSRPAATTIRPNGSAGSVASISAEALSSASTAQPATAIATSEDASSSTSLPGPLSSSITNPLSGDAQAPYSSSESSSRTAGAAPRPQHHHHHHHPALRVIPLGSTVATRSGTLGQTDEEEEDDTNTQEDHGETIIVVLNAFGPPRQRGQEGTMPTSATAGTTTPEADQQDTNTTHEGGEPNTRPRGRPQWLVVTMSSAYLTSFLAGASLNLDGEGGMNYDDLWAFTNMMGPARPVTTTQEAINRAGFHVGRFEGAIPGMRDYATLGDATKCLVCMCEYEEGEGLRALSCKHGFHQECIDKWLTTGANKCPICRAAAVVSDEGTATVAEEQA